MKSTIPNSISTTAAILLFLAPIALCKTTCTKFTPTVPVINVTSNYDAPVWEDQFQQMSAYFECESPPQHKGYYGCQSGRGYHFKPACARKALGALTVLGTVNHTLSATARSHLYDLVNDNLTAREKKHYSLLESIEGCITEQNFVTKDCLPQGSNGYLQSRPKKYCVDGVLSGCHGEGGNFENGLALRVCGGVLEMADRPWPAYNGVFIHVNAADKDMYSTNPAETKSTNKKICAKFDNGARQLVPSWAVGIATVSAVFYSLF